MHRRDVCKLGLAGLGTMAISRSASAMKRFTAASEKKKWVVLYGTSCGSTKEYAEFINKGLGEIADVVNIAQTTPKVEDYEFFIIGGWIRAGAIQPTNIKTFVTNNKSVLQDKIKGLFIVCGNQGSTTERLDTVQGYLTSNLITPSGVTDKPSKYLFGRAGTNCNPPYQYDNVSEDAGVTFGQQILTTAVQSLRHGLPGFYELYHSNAGMADPVMTIRYNLPAAGRVSLTVSDLSGRTLATLASGHREAGRYEEAWDTRKLSPGFYLYRLQAGNFTATRKAQVVRF